MMLYQQGAGIKPDDLTVRMHANAKFAMIRLTDREEIFVNTTDEADALITAACEAKRLLLAKREPADWCPAYTGPDDELDRAVYCDRQAGHPGSHRGAAGDGSEVAWPDAELVALKQEMDPPAASGCGEIGPDGYVCTRHDGGSHVAWAVECEAARWPIETAGPVPQCDSVLPLRHGGELKCTDDAGHYGAHTALGGKYRWLGHGADARNEQGDKIAPVSVTS